MYSGLSRWLRVATAAAFLLALESCTDSSLPTIAPGVPRRIAVDDDLQWPNVDGYMDAAEIVSVPGAFPEWNGLDPATNTLPPGTSYSCPQTVGTIMILASDKGNFVIAGVLVLEQELGYVRHGHPTGRYRVPETQHYNMERTYYIYGGFVDVECIGAYFQMGLNRVWIGNLQPFNYIGSGGPTSTGPHTMSGGGWAYKQANFTNGSTAGGSGATDWLQVLQKYMESGECTPGWKIIIDGVVKCPTNL